jgi:hypothetical protein
LKYDSGNSQMTLQKDMDDFLEYVENELVDTLP